MIEPNQTIEPPPGTPASGTTEMVMLTTFAVLCATVGGLLYLAAGVPASTAALIAIASLSVVVAVNATLRRRAATSVLNARIAELHMELTGLRTARSAAPLARPRMPLAPGAIPAAGPMGPMQPPPYPMAPPRGHLPPSQMIGPPSPSDLPAAPSGDATSTAPHAAAPDQAAEAPPAPPSAAQEASPAAPPTTPPLPSRMDWTVRPGLRREPVIRLPDDPPVTRPSGPLPLIAGRGEPHHMAGGVAAPMRHADGLEAPTPMSEDHAAPRSSGPLAATDAEAGDLLPQPAQAPHLKEPAAPMPGLEAAASFHAEDGMPAPDTAPLSMFRPGAEAWPRIIPKSPTTPLDLDTMQNLIEQLAGQLHHDPLAAMPAETAPDPLIAVPAASAPAQPAHAAALDDGPVREPAPFGHLALIAEAVEARRMDVLLDPILGLSDRRARHFELSVRLLTEAGDGLEAADYVPAAAGSGLLGRIDAEKLSRAADVLQRLRARGSGASLFSAVAGESLQDGHFAKAFTDVLAAEEDNTSRLILTFQQAEARNFSAAHWRAIADMARIGLKFAMTSVTDLDMDFEVLKRQGFDFIKLDAQVFLEGLPTPNGVIPAADICRHLADIGLGLIVGGIVAEKDLARILGFGAILGQGALFGGPRSVELERERRAA
jgi:cyclic-di-GMP phosphodiesterase TipF (flagellum assembly factor)